MGHGHAHGPGRGHDHGAANRRVLGLSLGLTVAFGVLQVVAGVAFSSLALVADAVHNVSDGAAIGLALGAAWLAGLPARGTRTFGWRRAEILAALVNALALVAIGVWILWQAYVRLDHPEDVRGLGVLVVGAVGIVANGIPVWLMVRHADHRNLNVRGALIHAATDVLGSVGTVIAALLVLGFGWDRADPIVGGLIGLVVLVSSWHLLRESVSILLEVAPRGVDPEDVGRALAAERGVVSVHDLHVWTITSGFPALSAHVVVAPDADHDRLLHRLQDVLREQFGLEHVTLQLDRDHASGLVIHRAGCPDGPRARTTSVPDPVAGREGPGETP